MNDIKPIPEEIKEYLAYDEYTGLLTWIKKSSKHSRTPIGSTVGYSKTGGYLRVTFKNIEYQIHRVAWFLKTGNQPPNEIDHHDKDKGNNVWTNLREATHSQNEHNKGKLKNNTSGYKGVTFNTVMNKWSARIGINGERVHIGYFDDPKEAHLAYCNKADELHRNFAHY